jgi:hypothetical protein
MLIVAIAEDNRWSFFLLYSKTLGFEFLSNFFVFKTFWRKDVSCVRTILTLKSIGKIFFMKKSILRHVILWMHCIDLLVWILD